MMGLLVASGSISRFLSPIWGKLAPPTYYINLILHY